MILYEIVDWGRVSGYGAITVTMATNKRDPNAHTSTSQSGQHKAVTLPPMVAAGQARIRPRSPGEKVHMGWLEDGRHATVIQQAAANARQSVADYARQATRRQAYADLGLEMPADEATTKQLEKQLAAATGESREEVVARALRLLAEKELGAAAVDPTKRTQKSLPFLPGGQPGVVRRPAKR